MLGTLVFQPIYTSISDIIGRKPPLYISFVLFFVGSVVFAVAQSMAVIILGRAIQGAGAGGLDVFAEIIVTDITTLQERPKYLGILAIPVAVATMAGPWVGSLFTEYVTWRWIGWINLPLTAAGFLLVVFFLRLRSPSNESLAISLGRVDSTGMALFFAGCIAFVLPISWAGALFAWSAWQTLVPLILGVVTLTVFAIYESRPAEPVMPYRVFGSATAAVTLAGAFIEGGVMYVVLQWIYLFFQAVYLQSPAQSSLSVLPLAVAVVTAGAVSAFLVEYTRKYCWNVWLGWVALTVGIGCLCSLHPGSSIAARAAIQVVAGIGLGTLHTNLFIPMQASVRNVDDSGIAIGQLVFFRLFGAVVGLSIASTVFSFIFGESVAPLLDLLSEDIMENLKDGNAAIGFIPQLHVLNVPASTLIALQRAYMMATRGIWIFLTIVCGLGFLLSLFMKEISLERDDLGRQQLEGREFLDDRLD